MKISVVIVSLEEEAGLRNGQGKGLGVVIRAFANQGEPRRLRALLRTRLYEPQTPLSLLWQGGAQAGGLQAAFLSTTLCSPQGLFLGCLLMLFPGKQTLPLP